MNDDEKTLILLQIVRIDGNVTNLALLGWSYVDMLDKLEELRKKNIVELSEDGMTLTASGRSTLHSLNRKLGRRGLYKFLMPDLYSRIPPIRTNDIYIPKKETMKEVVNAN